MTDWIKIERRSQQARSPGDGQSGESFASVTACAGYLEANTGSRRFDGVSIDSRLTHAAYIPYDQTIFELDRGSLWVLFEGKSRSRRFALLAIQDYHEQEEYILLQLTERGFSDLEAAKA